MVRFPQQLIPIVLIFGVVIVAFVVTRQLFVPESFGELGHYRADAIEEATVFEINYAGAQACGDCHDEIYEKKAESYHRGVSCEACHGPGAAHVEEPDENLLFAPTGRGYCQLCHGFNPSRPSGFPQILPAHHNPGKPCMSCHDPHDPIPPHIPEDCSACHRVISNVKLVSHHTDLPCTQCHTASEGHRKNPRLIRAEKPTSNQTCGTCHAEGADSSREIPRVNMKSHGERNLCWNCHYPHYPEAH